MPIESPFGTATGSGAVWTPKPKVIETGTAQVVIPVTGAHDVKLAFNQCRLTPNGFVRVRLSPDDGTTIKAGAADYMQQAIDDANSSFADRGDVAFGFGATSNDHIGTLEFFGLGAVSKTFFQGIVSDSSTEAIMRNGHTNFDDVINSIVLVASNGTFDQMDVDVLVR